MTLVDEMRGMTAECLEAYDNRIAGVADIRSGTAQQLAEFSDAREQMGDEQRQRLARYVDELRRDSAAFLDELDSTHQAMADEQGERLAAFVAELRADTAVLLTQLDTAHQAMSEEQGERLTASVAELRRGTAALLEELDTAHEAMAAEQRTRLATERAELASNAAETRRGLRAELDELRAVWQRLARLMQQRKAKRTVPARRQKASPDDLSQIRGIGPAVQGRLNKAGIATFAQLARTTPEGLKEALGDAARRIKPKAVIAQARDLAGML